MKKLLGIALVLLSPYVIAQQSGAGTVEMTRADFVQFPAINSLRLELFGVRLGQTEKEAGAALAVNATTFGKSYFINPETSANDIPSILLSTKVGYFAEIHFTHGKVYKICLYSSGRQYLVGNSKKLLDGAAGYPDSNLRLQLVGREDAVVRENRETIYVYTRKGMRITGGSLELVMPSNP